MNKWINKRPFCFVSLLKCTCMEPLAFFFSPVLPKYSRTTQRSLGGGSGVLSPSLSLTLYPSLPLPLSRRSHVPGFVNAPLLVLLLLRSLCIRPLPAFPTFFTCKATWWLASLAPLANSLREFFLRASTSFIHSWPSAGAAAPSIYSLPTLG